LKQLQAELDRLRKEVKEPETTPPEAYGNVASEKAPKKAAVPK